MRLLILFILTTLPTLVSAQTAPGNFVSCEGVGCSACDLVVMANYAIQWLMGIIAVLFAVLAAMAGWGLVTSAGNSGAKEDAKKKLINAIIGFVIVLGAWLLVDSILLGLTGTGADTWTDVQCGTQAQAIIVHTPLTVPPVLPSAGGNCPVGFVIDAFGSCVRQTTPVMPGPGGTCPQGYTIDAFGTCTPQTGPILPDAGGNCPPGYTIDAFGSCVFSTTPGSADPTADGSLTYNSGIQAQLAHASAPLQAVLNCIANTVPGNVGRVSSISDSMLVSGSKTWAQCLAGQCQHAANSCHYGGTSCAGKSYAVDFGDQQNNNIICSAARACGAQIADCSVHNGNHTHLSLSGCGCR